MALSETREACLEAVENCGDACITCEAGRCVRCADYYGLTLDNKCAKCVEDDCIQCVEEQAGVVQCLQRDHNEESNQCDNCLLCQDAKCLVCASDTVFDGIQCTACDQADSRCTACISPGECSQCASNYILDKGMCHTCAEMIANCKTCEQHFSGVWLCKKCAAGYSETFLNYGCGKCLNYVAQCLTCADQYPDLCAVCNVRDGYFYEDGYCERKDCPNNQFSFNATCRECGYFIQGCSICANKTVCQSCAPGYAITLAGKCGTCAQIEHCIMCRDDDSTQCARCGEVYVLAGGQCVHQDCPIQCTQCLDNGTCLQCQDNYILRDNTCTLCQDAFENCHSCNAESCTLCQDGYRLEDGKCSVGCIQLCSECVNETVCMRCEDGYYLLQQQCLRCADQYPFCQLCDKVQCLKCDNAYEQIDGQCYSRVEHCSEYSEVQHVCLSCEAGFFSLQGVCFACAANCIQCRAAETCERCAAGYLAAPNGKCFDCSNDTNCEKCDISGARCGFCKFPYILTESGVCSLPYCSEECELCDGHNKCAKCKQGYVAVDGDCVIDFCRVRDNEQCKECQVGYNVQGVLCVKASKKQAIIIASAVAGSVAVASGGVLLALKVHRKQVLRKQIAEKKSIQKKNSEVLEDDVDQAEQIMRPPPLAKSFSMVLQELQNRK